MDSGEESRLSTADKAGIIAIIVLMIGELALIALSGAARPAQPAGAQIVQAAATDQGN